MTKIKAFWTYINEDVPTPRFTRFTFNFVGVLVIIGVGLDILRWILL